MLPTINSASLQALISTRLHDLAASRPAGLLPPGMLHHGPAVTAPLASPAGALSGAAVLLSLSGATSPLSQASQANQTAAAAAQSPLQGHDFVKEGRRTRAGKALENLQQLVKEARMLQLLAGDPKARAHAAADLAKRIGNALKEFAANADSGAASDATLGSVTASASPADPSAASQPAAGQTATAAPVAADPSAAAAATAAPEAAASTGQSVAAEAKGAEAEAKTAATATGDSASDAATKASAAAGATPVKPETPAKADATAKEDGSAKADGAAKPEASAKPDPVAEHAALGSALYGKLNASGSVAFSRAKQISKEQEFFTVVRSTLSALKSMIERGVDAEKKASGNNGAPPSPEAADNRKQIKAAEKALEEAVKTIGHHGEGEPGGLSVDPNVTPSANATPDSAMSVVV